MPLVTTKEMLKKAQNNGYAVGAFNSNNIEIIHAIIETAEEEKSPVIIQINQAAINAELKYIIAIIKLFVENVDIPVALHLDHGTNYIQNIKCLHAGFTSLMYDGSSLPFEENIKNTKKICEIAHICNVPVEGEIGQIGKVDDSDEPGFAIEKTKDLMAKPEEAEEFVKQTQVDSLAIAVGTIHGCRTPFTKLDIERIKTIRKLVNCPLVLHGASGCNNEEIKKAIKAGISKINIYTLISISFVQKVREILNLQSNLIDPQSIFEPAKLVVKEVVRDRIRVFGCSNRI